MVSYSVDVTELVLKEQALAEAERAAQQAVTRLRDAIEALPAGFDLFDANDRIVLSNAHSRAQFPHIAALFDAQATYEELVRANVATGGLDSMGATVDEQLARRQAQRARADGTPVEVVIGDRTYRLHERRTADGGLLTIRFDITEEREQLIALERAQRQLSDAIDALPDGFALYDAEDRLIVCNERYRALYRESAPAIRPGARFEDILRYGLAHGQYPQARDREQAWLDERLRAHREPGPPTLQELPGNRWLRIDERRTRDGCVAGVRADVTALIRRAQTLKSQNLELDGDNARLSERVGRDPAGGIASMPSLVRQLNEEWARMRRHGTPLALVRVSLKPMDSAAFDVETSAGSAIDALAPLLMACARRPGDLLARAGEREFALLLPQLGSGGLAALRSHCDAVCARLPAGWSATVGIAASDEAPAPADPDELLARAAPPMHGHAAAATVVR